jgi:hypothetical protein
MWNAFRDVLYVKPERIPQQPVSTTCWPGGMPFQCRQCNRCRFNIRVSVTQTCSITAIVAVDYFSREDDHRFNLGNLKRTRRISVRRTDHHEEIGGGIDGGPARTPYVTDAVSPAISLWMSTPTSGADA